VIIDYMNDGLACPKCGNGSSSVVDSRPAIDGIRRRRECGACTTRYTTIEVQAALARRGTVPMAPQAMRRAVAEQVEAALRETIERVHTALAEDEVA
jgi:transcriptional regulator NrdR family protein